MRVVFLPKVGDYLVELSEILYQKEYFGFKDSAVEYVTKLVHDIDTTLHSRLKKPAPQHFNRYGKVCFMPTSQRTKPHSGMCFYAIQEELRDHLPGAAYHEQSCCRSTSVIKPARKDYLL